MRNLLWTATAVVVMLVGGSNVMAQAAPTVEGKTVPNPPPLPATPPPAGKDSIYAQGTWTIPANAKINKVTARIYKEEPNGDLTFVIEVTDNNPNPTNKAKTAGTYKTAPHDVDNTKKYTFIVDVYVDAAVPTDPPVKSGSPGILTGYKP